MKKKNISWRQLFTQSIRSRGRSYYLAGKAKKLSDDGDGQYSAIVRGSRNYHVMIQLDPDTLEVDYMDCSCPYAVDGHNCKHEAAVLYLMEEQGLLQTYDEFNPDNAEENKSAETTGKNSTGTTNNSGMEGTDSAAATCQPGIPVLSGKKLNLPAGMTEKKLKSSLLSLGSLKRENKKQLQEEHEGEHPFTPEDYHYFDTSDFLRQSEATPEVIRKAQKLLNKGEHGDLSLYATYYTSGDPQTIGVAEIDFYENFYDHRSVISSYADKRVKLVFNRHKLLESSCSGCWNYERTRSRIGHKPCEHEAAAIMILQDRIQGISFGDATNRDANSFLWTVSHQGIGRKALDAEEARPVEQLHISPRVRIDMNGITAGFYIGGKKEYKVRSIPDVLAAFRKRETMTFGKNTQMYLVEEALDPASRGWLDFMKNRQKEYDEIQYAIKNSSTFRYYNLRELGQIKSDLDLHARSLDEFFNLAMQNEAGVTASYVNSSNNAYVEKGLVKFEPGSLRLSLDLAPFYRKASHLFEGVKLTGTIPDFLFGDAYAYFLEEDRFFRIEGEQLQLLKALQASCEDGKIDLKIGRTQLTDFYRQILPELEKIADISETDPDVISRYLTPKPQFHFYLDLQNSMVLGTAEVSYSSTVYSLTDWIRDPEGLSLAGFRREGAEERALAVFMKYMSGYDDSLGVFLCSKSDAELFELLDHGLAELMDLGEVHVTDRFQRLKIKSRLPVQMGVQMESGLMDLSIRSEDLTEQELLDVLFSYHRNRKYIRLKNGDFLKLDESETLEQLSRMMAEMHLTPKEFVKGHMQVPAYRALYLDAMLAEMDDVYADRDAHYRDLVRSFQSVTNSDYKVPAGLNARLRKYQLEGYQWLRTLDQWNFGGILADEMGLGKTLEVITVLLSLKGEGTSIVVCPASLVYNWGEELKRFAPDLRFQLIAGTKKEREAQIAEAASYDVLVTSYDLLKRDIDLYEGVTFRFAVMDEAQNMKNPRTAAARSAKLLRAKTRYALTGTPIENRLSELWSIFDFIMPGFLYSYDDFRDAFESPIVKNDDDQARNGLQRMAAPFILRRKKKDVLRDLPDKLEETRYAHMEKKQQQLYDGEIVRMKKKLSEQTEEDFRTGKIEILAELTKIRQICCDPDLLFADYKGESAKTELCMDLVHSLIDGGHRTLLFSQFTSMLDILKERLDQEQIAYYEITGATPKKKRIELVNAFNEGDVPLFLISLKAGGTGLNLTGADSVIHFDPWWNVAAQNQATDRAHRIGQTHTVTVYKLIVKDTIEEKIQDLQERKVKLAEDILGGESVASTVLDREELLALLT